jgi:hypothetical protein
MFNKRQGCVIHLTLPRMRSGFLLKNLFLSRTYERGRTVECASKSKDAVYFFYIIPKEAMMATVTETEVQKLYVAYFSRPADVDGLKYWVNVLTTNPTGYQVASSNFAASAEYKAMYAGMNNTAVVSAVYQHLFGRTAEAAGVDYWAKLLDQKAITIDNVVTQIAAGAQGNDSVAYNGKVSVATSFTAHLDQPVEQKAYSTSAGLKMASDYIASVHDLQSGAMGMDPGNIDITIENMVKASGVSMDAPAAVVGVAEPIHPVFG